MFFGFVEFLGLVGLVKKNRVNSPIPFAESNSINTKNPMNTINSQHLYFFRPVKTQYNNQPSITGPRPVYKNSIRSLCQGCRNAATMTG